MNIDKRVRAILMHNNVNINEFNDITAIMGFKGKYLEIMKGGEKLKLKLPGIAYEPDEPEKSTIEKIDYILEHDIKEDEKEILEKLKEQVVKKIKEETKVKDKEEVKPKKPTKEELQSKKKHRKKVDINDDIINIL